MRSKKLQEIKLYLEEKVDEYNHPTFISNDPISIPHSYTKLQDIEITAFWTAMLSWGQRVTIINKSRALFQLMDNAPYDFIMNHEEQDLERFLSFKHRTFQPDDTLYFISFFKDYYSRNTSLESAFANGQDAYSKLQNFHNTFFALPDLLKRTRKHVSTPERKSSCKRLNMFLRWMVRQDDRGVDFGLWKELSPADLMIPLDVHVFKVSKSIGLIKRDKADWTTVEELTNVLRKMDPEDPVKYDYALFSVGVLEKG